MSEDGLIGRVREIIGATGMSQRRIAERIGIDESKLTKSLTGKRKFSSYELAALAELGGRTVEWVLSGSEPKQLSFAFRAGMLERDAAELAGRRIVSTILERRTAARDLGLVPIATPIAPPNPRGRYLDQAAAMARWAVERLAAPLHSLDLSGLIQAVERAFSVDIAVGELPARVDGLSYTAAEDRVIVLATTDRPGRQRFTLAHELAHVLWGDHGENPVEEQIQVGSKERTEQRANAFAASFLLPKAELLEQCAGRPTSDAFSELVRRFRVTPDFLSWRLLNLGLLDSAQRVRVGAATEAMAYSAAGCADEYRLSAVEASRDRAPAALADVYITAYLRGEVAAAPVADVTGFPVESIRTLLDQTEQDAWPDGFDGVE